MNSSINTNMIDGVVIPFQELSPEVLEGIIQEFVLREGTEYGAKEYSLPEKVEHVRKQLEQGKAQIIFDPKEESCDIVPARGTASFRGCP